MTTHEAVTILLVEDDEGHARLVSKNLRRGGFDNEILYAKNGQEAMDLIHSHGVYADTPRPRHLLVLLDLNMPVLDGYQVLERLKSDEDTKTIPVIILTTTDDSKEVNRCYDLGCNVYITKPVAYDEFTAAIRELGLFLTVMTMPDTS